MVNRSLFYPLYRSRPAVRSLVGCRTNRSQNDGCVRLLRAPKSGLSVLLTDEKRRNDTGILAQLPRGSLVIFRHYHVPDRPLVAAKWASACRRWGHHFSVSGDARLARRLNAGLHLREGDRKPFPDKCFRPFLTMAAHSVGALKAAERKGVDFILLSPLFPTNSHAEAPVLGVHRFARCTFYACRQTRIIALGGIDAGNAGRLTGLCRLNLAGIAAIDGWGNGERPDS